MLFNSIEFLLFLPIVFFILLVLINPNAPLTREQAIAKLKESKDLVELEMMSKEDFEALKAELTPIIMGN